MTNLITVNDVGFSYKSYDSDPVQAIEHVSFEVALANMWLYLVAMALVNRPLRNCSMVWSCRNTAMW